MNTELITDLSQALRPVKYISPYRVIIEWALITLLNLAVISAFYGIRPDLGYRLMEPLFASEIILNIVLIVIAGAAATSFAYPDRAQAHVFKPILALVFIGYSGLILMTTFRQPVLLDNLMNTAPHGAECLMCMLSFAAIPALWMFWRLRHLASTKPVLAGGTVLMLAAAIGCLGVRLVETEVVADGLMLWHYLPFIIISVLGLALGKKIFYW